MVRWTTENKKKRFLQQGLDEYMNGFEFLFTVVRTEGKVRTEVNIMEQDLSHE